MVILVLDNVLPEEPSCRSKIALATQVLLDAMRESEAREFQRSNYPFTHPTEYPRRLSKKIPKKEHPTSGVW